MTILTLLKKDNWSKTSDLDSLFSNEDSSKDKKIDTKDLDL